jgi:glycosyltransferase involved in cell wall biosynthesis
VLVIYEAGDVDNLAKQLEKLINQPQLQESLRRKAVQYFESEGTWLTEMKKVCDILQIEY